MTLPNGQRLRWNMGPDYTWDGFVPASAYPSTPIMQQNDASITITTAQETAITTKIDELRALIDAFAIGLTDEERSRYFKLGPERLPFDQKCDEYLHQRPDLVPPGVSVAEYDKDAAALAAVRRIIAKLDTIDTRLADTTIVIGADRLNVDTIFYNYLGFAERVGLSGAEGIRGELRELFPGRRSSPANPAPPAPPNP